jgi:tetratricopeptide (TPR) repeat protein
MTKNNKTLKEIYTDAFLSFKKGDLITAHASCNKILSIDPNHFDTILLLSTLERAKNNLNSSKNLLLKAIDIKPKNVTALSNIGTVYKELGKIEEAVSFYEKTLQIDPNYVNANYNLGLIYKKLKDNKKARIFLEKTTIIQPNFAFAHYSFANLLVEQKEYLEAKKYYQKAIEIRSDLISAQNNLGLVLRVVGEHKNAVICFKKVIKINPKHAGAHSNLARTLAELGDFDKAIDSYQEAINLEPNNLYLHYYLSELKKDILDSKLIEKSQSIVDNKNSTKRNLAYGNFLLAKAERKQKKYKLEFDHLVNAHNHYFQTKKEQFLLGLKYCFEDVLQITNFSHFNKSNSKEDYKLKPIFIVGVPRTGSTMVEKIIGSGKTSIPMGEETGIFEKYITQRILKKKSLNLGEVEEVRKDLFDIYKSKDLLLDENSTFTDKSLNNFFYINLIKLIFPNAKIINCRRNVLSSICSIFQNNLTELSWAHNLENIFKYFDNYFQIIESIKLKYSNLIYDLEFEKFTNNPEIESKKLMKICNLEWDKKCLDFYQRKDIISKTTSYQQIRKAVYKHPLDRYLPYKEFLNEFRKKYSWFV